MTLISHHSKTYRDSQPLAEQISPNIVVANRLLKPVCFEVRMGEKKYISGYSCRLEIEPELNGAMIL